MSKKIEAIPEDYLVNCKYIAEREETSKLQIAVMDLFEFTALSEEGAGNGNLCSDLQFQENKPVFVNRSKQTIEEIINSVGFYGAIPSALLMYRLACLFQGSATTYGREGYKFVWQFALKHKETGEVITFGEWKGGALFWTKFMGARDKSLPKSFKADIIKLIKVLVDEKMTHPYDGCVAGSVA